MASRRTWFILLAAFRCKEFYFMVFVSGIISHTSGANYSSLLESLLSLKKLQSNAIQAHLRA